MEVGQWESRCTEGVRNWTNSNSSGRANSSLVIGRISGRRGKNSVMVSVV